MDNRSCINCKYMLKGEDEIPCRECMHREGFVKWEPAEPESRPKMLPHAVPHYERSNSRIPEQVRISFSDGSTAVYDLRVEQPAPVIIENIRIIRRMKQGYVNKPLRRRGRK